MSPFYSCTANSWRPQGEGEEVAAINRQGLLLCGTLSLSLRWILTGMIFGGEGN